MTDLGTLGGANSWAKSINNLGQVAGVIERADGSRHAALWTVPIPVVTPEQAIADVTAHAAALVTGGTLSDGEGTALTVKLEAAQHQLDKGNAKLAANVLGVGAFINQVEAMVSGRRLTAEEAEPLSDSANAAIELIEAEPQRRSRLDHAVSRKRLRTPVTFGTSRTRSEGNRMVFLPGQAR